MLRTAAPEVKATLGTQNPHPPKIEVRDLDCYYGRFRAVQRVSLTVRECQITIRIRPRVA